MLPASSNLSENLNTRCLEITGLLLVINKNSAIVIPPYSYEIPHGTLTFPSVSDVTVSHRLHLVFLNMLISRLRINQCREGPYNAAFYFYVLAITYQLVAVNFLAHIFTHFLSFRTCKISKESYICTSMILALNRIRAE